MQKKLKVGFCLFFISVYILFAATYAEEPEKVKVVFKSLKGPLSFIGQNFISVVYKKDKDKAKEYEMVFFIEDNTRISHFKALDELNENDIVKVEYAEISRGTYTRRIAKRISLLRKGKTSLYLKGFKE
ncbi:MAG: hypothetical protein JSW40_08265 [Candidatus Omnitrophota bacterium]|nr:MAG: hypothetical protein JSW40_08265 [Candidatus Omnitrophota bacterium]